MFGGGGISARQVTPQAPRTSFVNHTRPLHFASLLVAFGQSTPLGCRQAHRHQVRRCGHTRCRWPGGCSVAEHGRGWRPSIYLWPLSEIRQCRGGRLVRAALVHRTAVGRLENLFSQACLMISLPCIRDKRTR